jgi:glutamate carboxypeptidase
LTDLKNGTSVNVGIVSGGRRANVIPDSAKAIIDVRVSNHEEDRRIKQALSEVRPINPEVSLKISGYEERPLWIRNPQSISLFQQAAAIGRQVGFDFKEVMSGGVSDANFAGALGVPTLDGLGPDGDGCHEISEYLEINSLIPGISMLAELFRLLD